MDKLLLLSLQFLPKTGRDTLLLRKPGLFCLTTMPLPGLCSRPGRPSLPTAGASEGCTAGTVGKKAENVSRG